MARTKTKTTAVAKTMGRRGRTGNGGQGAEDDPDTDTETTLQRENDELKAKLRALEEGATQARTVLERDNEVLRVRLANLQTASHPQPVIPVIPRPKGNSYSLQDKMGLKYDPEKYEEIKAVWKSLIRIAAFEDGATFANQPKEKVVKLAKKARTMVPFLRRFKADWATEAYLRRSLRNRKGHLKRKGAGTRTGGEPGSDDGGEGGSDDGGGGGSGDE